MYAFAFWQNFVTSLDLSLGVIMLLIQGGQVISSFATLVLNFMAQMRAGGIDSNEQSHQDQQGSHFYKPEFSFSNIIFLSVPSMYTVAYFAF